MSYWLSWKNESWYVKIVFFCELINIFIRRKMYRKKKTPADLEKRKLLCSYHECIKKTDDASPIDFVRFKCRWTHEIVLWFLGSLWWSSYKTKSSCIMSDGNILNHSLIIISMFTKVVMPSKNKLDCILLTCFWVIDKYTHKRLTRKVILPTLSNNRHKNIGALRAEKNNKLLVILTFEDPLSCLRTT